MRYGGGVRLKVKGLRLKERAGGISGGRHPGRLEPAPHGLLHDPTMRCGQSAFDESFSAGAAARFDHPQGCLRRPGGRFQLDFWAEQA